jgi:hypothetical protein
MTQGTAGVRATQIDADHVEIDVLIDGQLNTAKLTTVQAVALATAILATNPGHAMHQAEQLDDTTCAALGQAFLIPAARRSLEREAAKSMPGVLN